MEQRLKPRVGTLWYGMSDSFFVALAPITRGTYEGLSISNLERTTRRIRSPVVGTLMAEVNIYVPTEAHAGNTERRFGRILPKASHRKKSELCVSLRYSIHVPNCIRSNMFQFVKRGEDGSVGSLCLCICVQNRVPIVRWTHKEWW